MLPNNPHFFLVIGIIIFGLTIRPTSAHPTFFVALSIFFYILSTPYPDVDPGTNYHVGLVGAFTLGAAFDLLVLQSNPQESLKPNKQDKPASQLHFFSRLKWAVSLVFCPRGANWNWAVRGLRYPQYKTRWKYVLSQLSWLGYYYLLADVVGVVTRRNPAFHYPPAETLNAHGLGWQAVNVVLFWTTLVAFMEQSHLFFSALTVALGVWDPEDWPAYFGVWSNTKSVRTFWGRSWHQSLRRSFQPQAKYFTKAIFQLPSKSLKSIYIELFTCFFLSGLYHAAGDWVVLRNPSTALANVNFFILQAAIITLEDFVVFSGRKLGMRNVPTIASYLWVLGWMTVTCPMWIETMVLGNIFKGFAPKMSVVEKILDTFTMQI